MDQKRREKGDQLSFLAPDEAEKQAARRNLLGIIRRTWPWYGKLLPFTTFRT